MWITENIRLPIEIFEAQKNGELVIFAGAGVSIAAPSNLPSFENLATEISNGLIPYANDDISVDTFLGKLQNNGINVHDKTIELLSPTNSKPNRYHNNLLNLFENNEIKIVTTNFDEHFKTAAHEQGLDIQFYSAPAIPLGRDFSGVIHLHGSISNRATDLVLTDSDFGRAYFTDGWATNFLRGLFANYVVLFIGFSANDPVIRYMARGLGSNNRNRYAFTEEGKQDHWNHLQIESIEYPLGRHDLLEDAIESWVSSLQMGAFERRNFIRDIVSSPPENNVIEESYLKDQLKSNLGIRHFADFAKDFKWIDWMNENKMLDRLFLNDTKLIQSDRVIGEWFASFIKDDSEKMMNLIMKKGTLNEQTKFHLVRELNHHKGNISPKTLGKWLSIYLDHSSYRKNNYLLDNLLKGLNHPENKELIILLFEYLTRPYTVHKNKFSLNENEKELIDIEINIQGNDRLLKKIWEESIFPNIEYYATPLMNIVIGHLQMVTYYFQAAGYDGWDPISYSRSAIEPHEENRFPKDIDFIIDTARDLLEYLVSHNSTIAKGFIYQCFLSESKLLRRISIHAHKMIDEKDANQKIDWLINNNLIFELDFRHEVFQYIKFVYPQLSNKHRHKFIRHVKKQRQISMTLKKKSIDYEEYNLYYWLTLSDENCTIAKEAFDKAQLKNSDFAVREYPDLLSWMSSSGLTPIKSKVTEDEILRKNPENKDDIKWLLNYVEPDDPFGGREAFLKVLSKAIKHNKSWGWKLLNSVQTSNIKPDSDIWQAILAGFSKTDMNNKDLMEISKILLNHCDLYIFQHNVSNFFKSFTNSKDYHFQDSIDYIILIFKHLLSIVDSDINYSDDSLTQAINHPIGKMTDFFCHVYISIFKENKDREILHKIKNKIFETLLELRSDVSLQGVVILTNRLHVFMHIDEQWSVQNLIPLFNTENNNKEIAKKSWNAYAYGGRWNERLLKYLYPSLENIIPLIQELNKVTQERIYSLCISIFFYSKDYRDQLEQYILEHGARRDFEKLIQQISILLQELEFSAIKKSWNDWFKSYLTYRMENIPLKMKGKEFKKVVELLPFLEPVIEEYIELLTNSNHSINLEEDYIFYYISERKLGEKYPDLLLNYLEFVLKDHVLEFHNDDIFVIMHQILDSLETQNNKFKVVCEYIMTLNISKAVDLLRNFEEKFK